jgi:hypothetical protein
MFYRAKIKMKKLKNLLSKWQLNIKYSLIKEQLSLESSKKNHKMEKLQRLRKLKSKLRYKKEKICMMIMKWQKVNKNAQQ